MSDMSVEAAMGRKSRTPRRKTDDAKVSRIAGKSRGRDRMSRSDLLART
jgi:hypothetical protein